MIKEIESLELNKGEVAIFWLGQNSFILKTPTGTTFAIDLFLSRNPERTYVYPEPPISPEDVKGDYVLCTHDHWDHTDPEALPIIAGRSLNTLFLGPKESCDHLAELGVDRNRLKVMRALATCDIGDVKVTPYYSIPPKEAGTTHLGYLFEVEGAKIYNMGDTSQTVAANPEIVLSDVAKASPDVAIFPIVGDTPQRRPEDAYRFAKIAKPKIAVPCHYDCFANRTIDPNEFVRLFKEDRDVKPIVIPYKGVYIYKAES